MALAHRLFHMVAGAIFLILGVIHTFRLLYGWNAAWGTFVFPLWVSGIGVLVALYMSYWSLKTME